jgi:pyridoxamine 5'-phosphate oxidase
VLKEDEEVTPTEPINDLDHPVARKNFRVVVIRPFEVEELELASPPKRFRYTYQDDGSWKTDKIRP